MSRYFRNDGEQPVGFIVQRDIENPRNLLGLTLRRIVFGYEKLERFSFGDLAHDLVKATVSELDFVIKHETQKQLQEIADLKAEIARLKKVGP